MIPSFEIYQKSLFLMSICTISSVLNYWRKPYNLPLLNQIEQYSNNAALVTIFSGCLYILDISEVTKEFIFFILLAYNLRFLTAWLLTFLNIYFIVYGRKMIKYCPKFMKFLAVIHKRVNPTKLMYTINKYARLGFEKLTKGSSSKIKF